MKIFYGLSESYINPSSFPNTMKKKPLSDQFLWAMLIITATISIITTFGCSMAHAAVSDKNAINAIIGEAESESYLGKIAIAKTIINRGHLRGVYGLCATRVLQHKYSDVTYEASRQAWIYAKRTRNEGNWSATGWGTLGDIQQFRRQGWFKNCTIVDHIGNHYFYKEIK